MIFIPEKQLLCRAFLTAWPKISKWCLRWRSNRKLSITFSGFVAVVFSLGKVPRRPSDPSLSNPKKKVFGGPHGAKLNRLKEKNIRVLYCWQSIPKKNFFSKFLVKPFRIAQSQTSLFRAWMKILEGGTWVFLNFGNGQKFVQPSQHRQKIQKTKFLLQFPRDIYSGERLHATKKALDCLKSLRSQPDKHNLQIEFFVCHWCIRYIGAWWNNFNWMICDSYFCIPFNFPFDCTYTGLPHTKRRTGLYSLTLALSRDTRNTDWFS